MPGSWSLPPVPGYITFTCSGLADALEAFTLAEQQANEAGYHNTATWRGPDGEAEMLFWRDADERQRVIEAPSFRDWPRPVAALRWVWPATDTNELGTKGA